MDRDNPSPFGAAPSGNASGARQVLIFDADDTLWESNVLFERVIESYLDWIAHPTLDRAAARAVLDDVERATVQVHGYGTASLLHSLHDAVEAYRDRPATAGERAEITELAATLANHEVELLPGVEETLTELGTRHELLLLTKGAVDEQQRKIDASNLAHHFRAVHIVAEKREPTYRELLAAEGLTASSTWMIGNSPASDIRPARAAGLGTVLIPNPHTWVLEQDEVPAGVLTLARFPDLLDHF